MAQKTVQDAFLLAFPWEVLLLFYVVKLSCHCFHYHLGSAAKVACRIWHFVHLYRPRFIGNSVDHIQTAFCMALQVRFLAWAGFR